MPWCLVLLLVALAGCGQPGAPQPLVAWAHTGRAEERLALTLCAVHFQQVRPGRPLLLMFLPDGSYNAQVQAAAPSGGLPDVLRPGHLGKSPLLGGHV